jgi:lipid-A-disaccharide synthase
VSIVPNPESQIPNPGSPTIAIIAGEDSGDQLGADLIVALRQRYPQARFVGSGGARMQREGFESWYDIRELSVMGFVEVLKHLPRLLRLRRTLVARLLETRPDVVIGIDAPDFNLAVERRLKEAGLRTVHYVSPSVWAWREKRAAQIGRSADRVLCLFPMEPAIYARHGVDARFVGHPLADRFPLVADRVAAREALQLPQEAPVLALRPGSRPSELSRLGQLFIDAAHRVAAAIPGLRVVIPAANPQVHAMLKTDIFTLPNILARAAGLPDLPVPELMQDDCTAEKLADATLALFRDSERRGAVVAAFEHLHQALRGDDDHHAADRAATAVAELLEHAHARA